MAWRRHYQQQRPVIKSNQSRHISTVVLGPGDDYQPECTKRTTRTVKNAASCCVIQGRISGTVSPVFWFASNDKILLRDTQYFPMIFTNEVEVADVCQVTRYAYIHWNLQVIIEFHLLDGPTLELTITDEWPTTGSRTAGIVNRALYIASFASRYRVLTLLTRICKSGQIPTCGVQSTWNRYFTERRKSMDEEQTCTHSYTHLHFSLITVEGFYWSKTLHEGLCAPTTQAMNYDL